MKKADYHAIEFEQVSKRANGIAIFYQHLTLYLTVNPLLVVLYEAISSLIPKKEVSSNPEFLQWVKWNFWGILLVWGVALVIHALYVFLKAPILNWEDYRTNKYVEKEENQNNNFK